MAKAARRGKTLLAVCAALAAGAAVGVSGLCGCLASRCSGGADNEASADGTKKKGDNDSTTEGDVVVVALPSPQVTAVPKKNMVWIEPGAFVAGTPQGELPRIADEEMPGVQVFLGGFYIDQYPYPNEPGAIQTTNVTREQAENLCASIDKRLCTELEWERACKGPSNTTYEYGANHSAKTCAMSQGENLIPTGTNAGCRSGFDVFDLHGGAFEWTSSNWNRLAPTALAVVRGGSGVPSEVVGRCANARARNPDTKYADVGFRCCAGQKNDAEVQLEVDLPPEALKAVVNTSELAPQFESALASEALGATAPNGKFTVNRVWKWYPIGNEKLAVASGCAQAQPTTGRARCGVVVGRLREQGLQPLAFAPSGWWLPSVQLDDDRRVLWVYGGDVGGQYRRKVAYLWGRVGVGEPETAVKKSRRKR